MDGLNRISPSVLCAVWCDAVRCDTTLWQATADTMSVANGWYSSRVLFRFPSLFSGSVLRCCAFCSRCAIVLVFRTH